jgi:flagellar hook-associated protein 1 FlgK
VTTVHIDALSSALAGLTTTQQRIDTISRNISHAGAEGYTRKDQQQITTAPGFVQAGPIQRAIDTTIQQAIRDTTGNTARLQVEVSSLQNVETVLGQPGDDSGLSARLTKLQAAFQTLSMTPETSASYGAAVLAAQNVAGSFHDLYNAMETERSNAQTQLTQTVGDLNETVQQIDHVNKAIVAAGGTDTSDLEDQRDTLLTKLSGLMEVTTFKQSNGEIAIFTKNGTPLLDTFPRTIAASDLAAQPSGTGTPLIVVHNGKIGGLLALRDQIMPQAEAQLDDQARALTQEFKGLGIELFNDGGSTTLQTAPLDPLQVAGFSGRIAVNNAYVANPAAIRDGTSPTPLQPGDTTFIDQAVALFQRNNIAFDTTTGLAPTGSLIDVASNYMTARGDARAATQSELDHQNTLLQTYQDKQSQVSGVSVDDELSQLIVLQQAYAANARVVQTAQSLVDSLLKSV